jgi:hypothetical protein
MAEAFYSAMSIKDLKADLVSRGEAAFVSRASEKRELVDKLVELSGQGARAASPAKPRPKSPSRSRPKSPSKPRPKSPSRSTAGITGPQVRNLSTKKKLILILNSGRTLRGKIMDSDDASLNWKSEDGTKLVINFSDIASLVADTSGGRRTKKQKSHRRKTKKFYFF